MEADDDKKPTTSDVPAPDNVVRLDPAKRKTKATSPLTEGLTAAKGIASTLKAIMKERRVLPEDEAHPDFEPWHKDVKVSDSGKVLNNVFNTKLALTQSKHWQGVLGYDEFASRVVLLRPPPWSNAKVGDEWEDTAEFHARIWFESLPEWVVFSPSRSTIGTTVQAIARKHTFHPVRDYLNSLTFDGEPRSLTTYLNVPSTAYSEAVCKRWMVSAVTRVFEPGCQADYELVLEGPQGIGKSKALRTLAIHDDWYVGSMPNYQTKDAPMQLKGAWIVEDAELKATTSSHREASKQFMTIGKDKFRPPYGRYVIRQNRHCVMAGTANPPPDGRYLKDTTGNRRYWPLRCMGQINLVALEQDRAQLWAEAVVAYRAGHPRYLETPELEALATAEQAKRLMINDLHDEVLAWISSLPKTGELPNQSDVSVSEALAAIVGGKSHTRSDQMKVAKVFDTLGYQRYRPICLARHVIEKPEGRRSETTVTTVITVS
jgi:predicted P-loop ATPase